MGWCKKSYAAHQHEKHTTGSHFLRYGKKKPQPEGLPKVLDIGTLELKLENELVGLYQSLEGILVSQPRKIIQFMGSQNKEGVSSIAREFAVLTAREFGKTTLLLDAGMSAVTQHGVFNIEPAICVEELIGSSDPVDKALYQVGHSPLFFSKLLKGARPHPQLLITEGVQELFKRVGKNFDYLIIDAPPASTNFSISLCSVPVVSGVVLVLEAERTRWPVVENVRTRILKNDGKLLGIVLNKRRYHLPGFIYNRL